MKRAISNYLRTLGRFTAHLFREDPYRFLLLNLLGIFSKTILLVAFIVSIKTVVVVYQGKLEIAWDYIVTESGIAPQTLDWVTPVALVALASLFVLALFVASGLSGIVYSHIMVKYTYECSANVRRGKSAEFFFRLAAKDIQAAKHEIKDYIEDTDPKLDRSIKLSTVYLFEAIQGTSIILICFLALGLIMPTIMMIILLVSLVVAPIFLFKNYRHGSRVMTDESRLRDQIRERKARIVDMEGESVLACSDAFLSDVLGSDDERRAAFLNKQGERDARLVQLMIHFVLGLFFSGALWVLFLESDNLSGDSIGRMVIVFFLIRFIFGIMQNTLTALRNLNMEYKFLKTGF